MLKEMKMNELMVVNGGYYGYAEKPGNQQLSNNDTKVISSAIMFALYASPLCPAVAAAQYYASLK